MLVKRYHAKDMQQAMDMVIKELGSDAVILNSRKVRKKGFKYLFQRPIMEVMVAYDPAKIPAAKRFTASIPEEAEKDRQQSRENEAEAAIRAAEMSKQQLSQLDERIDSLDEMLHSFVNKFQYIKRDITYDYSGEVENLFVRLVENQVRDELAHSIARETDDILQKQTGARAAEVMEHLIMERIGTPEPIIAKKFQQKIILVIGPTGVGKTTSIVKLAADFALNQKKKVGIINTDTYRIAAQEQLRTYADILSIPLSIVYNPGELEEELQEAMSDRDVIFIDTAGKRPGDEQHRADVEMIIDIAKPEDVLLCVSASVGFAALTEIIDTYNYVRDYRLVVTKLDETRYRGTVLNLCWYAGKRLAYFTTGQNVPDDIEHVDVALLVKQIMGQ